MAEVEEKLDAVQKLVNAGKPIKENEDAKAILAEFDNILNAVKDFALHLIFLSNTLTH